MLAGDDSMMAGNRNKVFPAMSVKREPPPVTDASRRRATITRKWDSLEKELKSNQNDTSGVAVNVSQIDIKMKVFKQTLPSHSCLHLIICVISYFLS